jgi:transposase-like protein
MSKETRRQHAAEQKLAILREHLVDRVPVSEVCEKHKIQPSLFYYWQKQLFENGAAAFGPTRPGPSREQQHQAARIEHLEAKLAKKDAVIAELASDLVAAKKEAGEP